MVFTDEICWRLFWQKLCKNLKKIADKRIRLTIDILPQMSEKQFKQSCPQQSLTHYAFTPLMFSVRQTVSWSCGTSTNLTVCAPSRVTSMRRTSLAWLPMETMLPVVRNDCIKIYSDNVASESLTRHSFDICSAKHGLLFNSSLEAVMTAPLLPGTIHITI